jgi:hypothetical protein
LHISIPASLTSSSNSDGFPTGSFEFTPACEKESPPRDIAAATEALFLIKSLRFSFMALGKLENLSYSNCPGLQ